MTDNIIFRIIMILIGLWMLLKCYREAHPRKSGVKLICYSVDCLHNSAQGDAPITVCTRDACRINVSGRCLNYAAGLPMHPMCRVAPPADDTNQPEED